MAEATAAGLAWPEGATSIFGWLISHVVPCADGTETTGKVASGRGRLFVPVHNIPEPVAASLERVPPTLTTHNLSFTSKCGGQ